MTLATGLTSVSLGAQPRTASITASLTIVDALNGTAVPAPTVSIGPGGRVTLSSPAPVRAPASRIMMLVGVADDDAAPSANGLAIAIHSTRSARTTSSGRAASAGRNGLVHAAGADDSNPVTYDVHLGTSRSRSTVNLTVRYLIVAGT